MARAIRATALPALPLTAMPCAPRKAAAIGHMVVIGRKATVRAAIARKVIARKATVPAAIGPMVARAGRDTPALAVAASTAAADSRAAETVPAAAHAGAKSS